MFFEVFSGIMIPFIGTLLGSSAVFFVKKKGIVPVQKYLSAFASGIMFAASVWSLIIPSLEMGEGDIKSVTETLAGFFFGFIFMIWADNLTEKINCESLMGKNTALQFFAVTVHNIPEGLAVGMVYSVMIYENDSSAFLSALILSLGIGIQNIPEGAIISLPLYSKNMKRSRAFLYGAFSGIVEPIAAVVSVLSYKVVGILLPFLLSFAAGAMVYVVIKQLIPDMYSENSKQNNLTTLIFSAGFMVMMGLDVLLG